MFSYAASNLKTYTRQWMHPYEAIQNGHAHVCLPWLIQESWTGMGTVKARVVYMYINQGSQLVPRLHTWARPGPARFIGPAIHLSSCSHGNTHTTGAPEFTFGYPRLNELAAQTKPTKTSPPAKPGQLFVSPSLTRPGNIFLFTHIHWQEYECGTITTLDTVSDKKRVFSRSWTSLANENRMPTQTEQLPKKGK